MFGGGANAGRGRQAKYRGEDYKFGDRESKSYLQQVKEYMDLITEMGYQTSGYVCYVSLRKVEKVN